MDSGSTDIRMEEFRARLKKGGLKVTPQRVAVHEAMLKLVHASADMVTAEITKGGDRRKVTVASVYNILSQLSSIGIYKRRMSSSSKMYFDVDPSRHMHLYDTVNNELVNVTDDLTCREIEEKLVSRRFKGYRIEGVEIQILVRPSPKRRK